MSFVGQFKTWTKKVKKEADNAFQNICRDVSHEIAEKTPCSTGKLIGQWSPSKNTETRHDYEGGQSAWIKTATGWVKDPAIARQNRQAAMANLEPRIEGSVSQLEMGDTYYFTNHTEYSLIAEYEGWDQYGGKRGPYRMVGRTWAEIDNIVRTAVAKTKGDL